MRTLAVLKAALVDVGGTLWPDRWAPEAETFYIERLTNRFALNRLQIERLLSELEARDPALANPLPLTQDSNAMAAESLDAAGPHHVDPGELLQTMDLPAAGVIEPLSGAREFLLRLKSLKLRTIVFSNATFRTC